MAEKTRPIIIAGNWKMHKSIDEARHFIRELIPLISGTSNLVYLATPCTLIQAAVTESAESSIIIGAQNMHDSKAGAYTGEISSSMLKDVGAKFVLIGHSERRHIFGEKNDFINRKVVRAFSEDLQPILCVGETDRERDLGLAQKVLENQLQEGLNDVSKELLPRLILAYEPVWAIGTGKTATPEQAQEMHACCRKFLAKKWGEKIATQVAILYGGSVKPENVFALLQQTDIDGVLAGGASLDVESFSRLINF